MSRHLLWSLLIFVLIKLYLVSNNGGSLTIKVFDVGQGDAVLIKTQQNRLILIDGGPDFEVDRYMDKEFWLNNCHVDLLLLTHPHQDHLKGLNRLLTRCSIGSVVFRPVEYESREYNIWLENLYRVNVICPKVGDIITIDDIKLVVVWPPEEDEFQENINNSSVSVLLDYGNFEALFLGDLEKEASSLLDKNLLSKYVQGRLEVYKVPHHGSIDSFNPALISWLKPKLCVVSVGENKYGHPSLEALQFMENQGCAVQRTDEQGTIEVLIN